MSEIISCVSVYKTHLATEQALENLHAMEFDLSRVSLVGKGYHSEEHPIGIFKLTDKQHHYCGLQAAIWDAAWARLAGTGFFWVPVFGTLVAAGPIVTFLVKRLEETDAGAGYGVLGGALYAIGVPRQSISQYEEYVKGERFLLIVHGDRQSVERACNILHCQEQQVAVHTASQFNMAGRPSALDQSGHDQ